MMRGGKGRLPELGAGSHANRTPVREPPCREKAPQRDLPTGAVV